MVAEIIRVLVLMNTGGVKGPRGAIEQLDEMKRGAESYK